MKRNKWIIGLINLVFLLETQMTVLKLLYFVTSLLRSLQFWERGQKGKKRMSSSKVNIMVIRTSLKDKVEDRSSWKKYICVVANQLDVT